MNEVVMAALEIMGSGVLSLFVVMIIIALSVVLLNYIDQHSLDKKNEE